MLLNREIYWPLLDFMTLVALLAYQHPQPFFTVAICFICKTLTKSSPPPHRLAVFSHFYAGEKDRLMT